MDRAWPPATGPARPVTSYDVAVAAGVAQSTVSYCVRRDSETSPDTRARVQAVAEFTLRANPDLVNGIGRALAANGMRRRLMTVPAETEAAAVAGRGARLALGRPTPERAGRQRRPQRPAPGQSTQHAW